MNHIRELLKIAARRLEISRWLSALHDVALIAAVVALVLMLADRAPAESFVPWMWVAPVLIGLVLIASLVIWRRRRFSEMHVALAVDERLDLREKLSTALHCQKRDDAFARAAVEDAVKVASDERTVERTRRLFPVEAPKRWWISPLVILLTIMLGFLSNANLFARDAQQIQQVNEAKEQSIQALDEAIKAIESQDELSAEMSALLEDMEEDMGDLGEVEQPEDIKREALKKITDLNNKLNELINGEKGKTNEAVKDMLAELNPPQDGPASELAEALADGDFKKASKALQKLMEDMAQGNLDQEQMDKLAQQLEDLAKQLEDLAKQQQQLEDALKQAGMNPQLAQNPQALQQAIQNNQNLNQQQKQQLQQMAKAQQQAQQMCQGMCQGLGQMAQGMQNGQMGQAQQGGQQAQQMINQLEAMQRMLQQAQAAAGQCQGQGQALGQQLALQQQMMQKMGQGAGQKRGEGGGQNPVAPTPTGTNAKQERGPLLNNDIVARWFVQGDQVRGESKAKIQQAAATIVENLEEAQDDDHLPPKYHDSNRHYFGELGKTLKDDVPTPEAAAAEPQQPAAQE